MKTRAHLFISGNVQGVFFRSYTRQEANKKNVKGWVRNLPDGRVEVVLEGEEEAVRKIIELCRKGPSYARVKGIKIKWEDYKGEFKSFKIRYF
jgi:acylphosphatase